MARRSLKRIHQMTFADWEKAFPDEASCAAYLTKNRWPSGTVRCPRCGNVLVKPHGTMEFNWLCNACSPSATSYRFSVIAGTIFENTNKPLLDWFRVVHLMLAGKKGTSALQIQRILGFGSYETAHSMCHKIRAALIEPEEKLGGIVEVDETYIGGKAKNRHMHKRGDVGTAGKIAVIGAVKRKGNVILRVIENTDTMTLDR